MTMTTLMLLAGCHSPGVIEPADSSAPCLENQVMSPTGRCVDAEDDG